MKSGQDAKMQLQTPVNKSWAAGKLGGRTGLQTTPGKLLRQGGRLK